MQFSSVILAAAAFALTSAVQFTNPTFATITAGKAFNITWTNASGPVTVLLKNGPPGALVTVNTIGSGLSGGSFVWTPSASLAADTYALEINDGDDTNYSTQFQLINGAAVTSSVSSAVSSLSSIISSLSGNRTTTAASSSGTASTNASTTRGSSSTRTSSTGASTGTQSSTGAPDSSSASGLASPLALVFLAVAAVMTLH